MQRTKMAQGHDCQQHRLYALTFEPLDHRAEFGGAPIGHDFEHIIHASLNR